MAARTLTLKQRLLLTGLVLAVTPILALGIVCWRQFDLVSKTALTGSEKLANADLAQAGETAYDAVNTAQDDVLQSLQVARAALDGYGGLQVNRHRHTTWTATNQETHEEKRVAVPMAYVGPARQERRYRAPHKQLVEEVRDLTGATCTVFERMNPAGDMLRIFTTVLTPTGKRATGTFIPAHSTNGSNNPVVSTVLAGKTFRGKATVVGTPYMTAYEPITAQDGSVIGILYTGLPESVEAARLKDRLSGTRAAQRGEIFALSANGEYLFTTRKEASLDSASRHKFVLGAMAHPAEASVERYTSPQGVPMIAHLRYFDSWKWLLGVAIPEQEFLETAQSIRSIAGRSQNWLGGVFVASILASLLIWTRYAGLMAGQLSAFARRTREDGQRILAWSKRLAQSSRQHGSGVEEHLAAVEQSAARIQNAARDSEKRIERALRDSSSSDEQAHATKQHLASMQSSMHELNAVNSKISGLMKSVDEIAFQSRILALNARIEAARAGEAGVSFAVVAEQFGALAERCAAAANSTTEFLTASSHSTQDGLQNLQNLSAAVEQMGSHAGQIRATVDQVHESAGEQLRASDDIAKALSIIREVIDHNHQMAANSSRASQELQNLAGDLHKHTNELSLMVEGRKQKPMPGPQLVNADRKGKAKPARAPHSAAVKVPANSRSARRAC